MARGSVERLMVDVIATVTGGGAAGDQTARAIRRGGGLVGIESTVTPPEGIPVEFLDWPFLQEHATVEDHLAAARELKPKYAVAPDVQDDRSLDEALDIAGGLARHAKFVIVIPKTVAVERVPSHYIAGVPFRNEWDTDTGVNDFSDFSGRPVHILGGNPTEQIELADRFQYRVTSVDSPNVFAWADGGRVWVARLGGADSVRRLIVDDLTSAERTFDTEASERRVRDLLLDIEGVPDDARDDTLLQLLDREAVKDLEPGDFLRAINAEFLQDERAAIEAATGVPSYVELLRRRTARIEFSIGNLVEAWNEGRRVTRLSEVEPGRGPPPPAPEGLHGGGREDVLEQFLEAAIEEEIGRVEATRGLDTFEDG